jgi:hypothetical protein
MTEERPADEPVTRTGQFPDTIEPRAPGREAEAPRPDWPPLPAAKGHGCLTVVVVCVSGLIALWLLGLFVLWLFMGGGIR